jgi:RNA-directed DNA polymerase
MAKSMVRHSVKPSELWTAINWKKFQKIVFRLQKRIYKAVQANDMRKAKSLQRLILKSQAARLLAIRQVTQLNNGKRTAGIDGKKALQGGERLQLAETLRQHALDWKHQGLRSIPIPKKDGTTRLLKVPTIADRAWQCLAKLALEPAHEATFHARSYGFRPGRSTHDAQHMVFLSLNSTRNGHSKRVIELDIEKCFDRISHSAIMDRLIAPRELKLGIFRCLKAGTSPGYPDSGTPQGGVVSPLLANIALNGIEKLHRYHRSPKNRITPNTPADDITEPSIRYADDMVIFLRPQDDAEAILRRIEVFLAARGMNVSQKKTKVTASTEGFDFLGWHFQVQSNRKVRCVPSKDNHLAVKVKIKAIVNSSNIGATEKSKRLAPIIRGWRNYHRYCRMDASHHRLWETRLRTWRVFSQEKKLNRQDVNNLVNKAFPAVKTEIFGHTLVKGTKSPFDGNIEYWSKRKSRLYENSVLGRLIRKQNRSCGHCGLKFLGEDNIELHHKDRNHNNWQGNNLMATHEACHQTIHMGKRQHDA